MPPLTRCDMKKLASQTSSGPHKSVWPPLDLKRSGPRQAHSHAFCRQGRRGRQRAFRCRVLTSTSGRRHSRQPLVFESGDADGILHTTEVAFLPMPWLDASATARSDLECSTRMPPYGVTRVNASARVVDRYRIARAAPVCAVELEFFLIDVRAASFRCPLCRGRQNAARRLKPCRSARSTSSIEFFTDLMTPAKRWISPPPTAISRQSPASLRNHLITVTMPLRAADMRGCSKMLVQRALARRQALPRSLWRNRYED